MNAVWELDFYARPILDEHQKKLWEVLICNRDRTFEYSQYCPGAEANARWLQTAIDTALEQWRSQAHSADALPEKIRFFRQPMYNIITRACDGAGIPYQPSRRTFALYQWLQERQQSIYPQHPGFQSLIPPPLAMEPSAPQPLPDALVGSSWTFAALSLEELSDRHQWEIAFGDDLPLQLLDLPADAVIPGLVIFSPRAIPLAGWMSGLELAWLKPDLETRQLLLETGTNDRWILARLSTDQLLDEATQLNEAKQQVQQVHFLAVQSSPEASGFAGFWLLQEIHQL